MDFETNFDQGGGGLLLPMSAIQRLDFPNRPEDGFLRRHGWFNPQPLFPAALVLLLVGSDLDGGHVPLPIRGRVTARLGGAIALTFSDVQVFSLLNDELAVAVVDTGNAKSPDESRLPAFCDHTFFRCPVDGEPGGISGHEIQDRAAADHRLLTTIELARVKRHGLCVGRHESDCMAFGGKGAVGIEE